MDERIHIRNTVASLSLPASSQKGRQRRYKKPNHQARQILAQRDGHGSLLHKRKDDKRRPGKSRKKECR